MFKLDERTLASLRPVYARRSEIDGLDHEFMGLLQEEFELDEGEHVPIEQPSAIVPRPLATDDTTVAVIRPLSAKAWKTRGFC